MSFEKLQDDFEAWLADKTGNSAATFKSWRTEDKQYGKTPGDGYARGGLEIGLESWVASRESLVIELPSEDDTRCDTVAEIAKQEAYNLALGECASAIEAAGLKVKP